MQGGITVNSGTHDITITGAFSASSGGTFNGGTAVQTFSGTTSFGSGAGTINFNDLTVTTGSTLSNATNSKSFNIAGDFTLAGTGNYIAGMETVTFNGTTQSTTGGPTFYNLMISNTSLNIPGLAINSVFISHQLTFTSGKIITSALSGVVLMATAIPITGASASSYINGNQTDFLATGTSNVKFEVGNSVYAPVSLSIIGAAAGSRINGSVDQGTDPNETSGCTGGNCSGINQGAKVNQYWSLKSTGTTGTYSATFYLTNTTNTGTPSAYQVRKYDPTVWTSAGGTVAGTTITTAAGLSTATGITSEFEVGTPNTLSAGNNPANKTICTGSNTTFTTTASPSVPPAGIQWQRSTSAAPSTFVDISANLDAGTSYSNFTTTVLTLTGSTTALNGYNYRATFTNVNGTVTTTAAVLTVTATVGTPTTPTPSATTICQASSPTAYTTSAMNATSYNWSVTGSGNSISGTGTTGTVTWAPGFTGTATISVTANGCNGPSASASTTVTVTATVGTPTTPTPSATTICQASAPTTYTTSATNSTSYNWSVTGLGNSISGTGTTGTVTWAAGFTGTATISVTANGCSGPSASASTTITVTATVGTPTTPSPSATTICQASSPIAYTTSATNATSYNWSVTGSGNSISGTGTTGTVTWAPGFTGTATISVTANGCNGPSASASTTVTVTPDTWTGTASTDWTDAGNWTCGVPTSTINVVIPSGGNEPILPAPSVYSVHNITIASGASLTLNTSGADTAVLIITGSYANSGTLTNNGKLILNGDVAQSFPGSSAIVTAMNVLEVNNSNGVTIDKSFTLTGVLTPTAGTIALGNNYITLKSDATNTARVGVVGATTPFSYSIGRFVVQRYINSNRAWRLMTAPVSASSSIYNGWQLGGVTTVTSPSVAGQGEYVTGSGATSANGLDAGVSGNYSLKIYNTTTGALDGVTNTKTAAISPGYPNSTASNVGYFNFIRGDRTPSNIDPLQTNSTLTTLSDTGKLQTGQYTFPAIPVHDKYSLIGNPYASPVYFPDITFTNVARRFYAWDPQINQVGAYVIADDQDGDGEWSYNIDTALTPQRLDIQSSQAVFVQTIADGPASLTFNESNKSGNDVGLLFRPARPSAAITSFRTNLFLLNANNSVAVADGIFAQFSTDFSNGVDVQDGVKFPNVNETFSLIRNGALLSLERRQPITATDTLFFSLTRSSQRAYQFQFKTDGLYQAGISAFLEDSYLKTSTAIDLSVASTINFTITADAASQAANRFRVVFKPSAGGPLPVTFTSVKAYQQNSAINVSWKVENEMNIKEYQVEKSTDGIHFGNAVIVKATGNNGSTANYQWPDANPVAGNNYYRITSVDINGKAEHSNIVKVFMGRGKAGLMVYPNPVVDGNINLQLVNQPGGRYSIRLLNKVGQEIMAKQIEHEEGSSTQTLKISKTIAHGTYQLEITKPDHSKSIINVLK